MKNFKFSTILLYLIFVFGITFIGCPVVLAADVDFIAGEYVSSDGKHTIDIGSDNTVLYDDTYSLKINDKINGDTITGKIGTNNKSITFYQLNDSKIVTGPVVNYTYGGKTVYLYDYTVFTLNKAPVVDDSGSIEVWHDGVKINSYGDLQSAVDASLSGDTIKINNNFDVDRGAYIDKNIIIEGNLKTINPTTWNNPLIVVKSGVSLDINNLSIDGKATGFEPNYDVVTHKDYNIPIKSGTDASDPKRTLALIISKGDLKLNSVNLTNNYTAGNGNINVVSGKLTINNSNFEHNRATKGGVLYIGSNINVDEKVYPVKSVVINNSNFKLNYSNGNGGAILVYNTDDVEINKSNFISNTGHYASGGAIVIEKENASGYHSVGNKLGLDFIKFRVNDSVFDGNWVGNDGAAIENKDAELTINNTIFRKNVGVHSTSSCGAVSFVVDRNFGGNQIFNNCLFEANEGAVSAIADHATKANIEIRNTKFIGNISHESILLYSSDVLFEDVEFKDEKVVDSVVDIRSYHALVPEFAPPKVTFKNVNFENTIYSASDILIRKQSSDLTKDQYTVILEGDVNGNIDLWHKNKLIIKGNYKGKINTDSTVDNSNVLVEDTANVDGEININVDEYKVTLVVPNYDGKQLLDDLLNTYKYIYSEAKTFTKSEFFLEHLVSVPTHSLVIYTDAAYTTPWDYVVDDNITVYGKWVEHTHVYNGYMLQDNAIYEQCECGYLGKKLYLEIPTDLVENDLEKAIIVKNETALTENDYVITYQVMNEEDKWVNFDGVPVAYGKYKVKLTYNNLVLEEEYTITEREVVDDPEEDDTIIDDSKDDEIVTDNNNEETDDELNKNNPITSDGIIKTFIVFILGVIGIGILIILRKKVFQKNNYN